MRIRIALLLPALLILAGCASLPPRNAAVESVFQQRTKLKEKYGEVGSVNGQLVAGMKAVDVRNCPPDFRAAWFDYLVEAEGLDTRIKRIAMLASADSNPADNLPALLKLLGKNQAMGMYLLGALDKVDDAWGKLERIAMKYGATPER